jgi:membrane protein involved in colicin uptake
MPPTSNAGLNQMTPAQQRAEVARQQREARAAQKAAEQEARRQAREQAAAERRAKQEAARAERERQRTINSTIRATEHIATSRLGQDIIRGVFGTLFGRK